MKVFNSDVLVVGCGLSGAVIARHLAEQCGKKVCILERRNHIGGNMYDYYDEHKILVHKYGPHTFHTTKKFLYDYMCKYALWEPYKLTCMAHFNGKTTPTPFNFTTIDAYYDKEKATAIKDHIKVAFAGRTAATVLEVLDSNDALVREYAQFLYDNDYSLYTAKQWGVSPSEIDPSVLKRVPLRFSYDVGYFDDPYQVMPKTTFTDFFINLLDHPNITVQLGTDALAHLSISENGLDLLFDTNKTDFPIIYTGALDELFGLCEGNLPYRSLHFDLCYEDIKSKQDAPVVAYPKAEGYTRITEYKKLPVQNVQGTTYAVEYPLQYNPSQGTEPYYPVLTEQSMIQYEKYCTMASKIPNLYCCGRLADFKYYNMDQALERALDLAEKLLEEYK